MAKRDVHIGSPAPRQYGSVRDRICSGKECRYGREHAAARRWLCRIRVPAASSPRRHRWDHQDRVWLDVPAHLALYRWAWTGRLCDPPEQVLHFHLLGRSRRPHLENRKRISQYQPLQRRVIEFLPSFKWKNINLAASIYIQFSGTNVGGSFIIGLSRLYAI